jgi:lysozyme
MPLGELSAMTDAHPADALFSALKREEGFSAYCYMCPAGAHSVGYGRNIDGDGGLGITEAEGEMLLRNDVARVFAECDARFPWFDELDSARQTVVAQLAFQLGMPRLAGFVRMLAALATRPPDYRLAATELLDSRYATQVPNRARRLASQLAHGTFDDT